MPDKSRYGKGKRLVRSKRKKTGQGIMAAATEQPPVSQPTGPVPQAEATTRLPDTSAPSAAVSTVFYPYIFTELRRIGIIAGIMLVILIVLAVVLS
jgi:hypothetical protein